MLWWYMMRGGCLHRVFSSPHQGALNISSNFNSIPASYSLLCCYIFLKWRMRLPVQENFHGCRLAAADKRVSLPWPPKPDRVKVSVSCHESGPGAWERHECCLGSWSRVTWRSLVTECEEISRGCRDPGSEFSMIHSVQAWVRKY